jgi:chromosome segregation ATPase
MRTPRFELVGAAAVIAALALSPSALAQSGDSGGPPQNLKQCKRFLSSVDDALVWENKRYAKAYAKLDARRDALKARQTKLTAAQTTLNEHMETLRAAIEDQANPLSQEDADRMVEEYNSLIPAFESNRLKLRTIKDTLEGLKFDFSEAKKLHRSNVRSTIAYRRQVAAYCKRFKA